MHCEIAASQHYPTRPAEALREAFVNLDDKFIEKSKKLVNEFGATLADLELHSNGFECNLGPALHYDFFLKIIKLI